MKVWLEASLLTKIFSVMFSQVYWRSGAKVEERALSRENVSLAVTKSSKPIGSASTKEEWAKHGKE